MLINASFVLLNQQAGTITNHLPFDAHAEKARRTIEQKAIQSKGLLQAFIRIVLFFYAILHNYKHESNEVKRMGTNLRERCKTFLNTLQTPVTKFCRQIGISPSSFYQWQRGFFELSTETQQRINNFLIRYGF